jgi:septum site-determining protein MinC
VRSGQQLYAERQSLVIIGSVNEGAEVLADGDVFVFGRLCGRVVAGLGGQGVEGASHQIFATSFEPSLVGIGSVFVVPDDHLACGKLRNKAVNISLRSGGSAGGDSGAGVVSVPCEVETERTVEMIFRLISL